MVTGLDLGVILITWRVASFRVLTKNALICAQGVGHTMQACTGTLTRLVYMAFSKLMFTSHDVIAASNKNNLTLVRTCASSLMRLESSLIRIESMRIGCALKLHCSANTALEFIILNMCL